MSRKDTFRGTIVPGRVAGEYTTLPALAYIYACGNCQYRFVADTSEGIETVRLMHLRTVHPELVVETLWADSPLSGVLP